MKPLFSSALLLILFAAFSFGNGNIQVSEKPQTKRVEVNFNRTLEFNDLVKIKLDLSDKGITIIYRLLEFDENGGLTSIDFKVDCNDGFSGSAKSNTITYTSKFGFYREYNEGVQSPFGTGKLD